MHNGNKWFAPWASDKTVSGRQWNNWVAEEQQQQRREHEEEDDEEKEYEAEQGYKEETPDNQKLAENKPEKICSGCLGLGNTFYFTYIVPIVYLYYT